MTYRQMRTILAWLVATDGRFAGADALRDERDRWAVALHDAALGRTVPLSDFSVFAQNAPLFLGRPRAQPLHFWATSEADLHMAHLLGILRQVEGAYPRWAIQAIFGNEQGRYEVMLIDQERPAGVHLVHTVEDFYRVFPPRQGGSLPLH